MFALQKLLRADHRHPGQALKMRVRRDQESPSHLSRSIDDCVGHCQAAIQADPRREQGHAFIERRHACPQRRGEKPVGGSGTLRGQRFL